MVFEKTKVGEGDKATGHWKRVSPTPGDVDKEKIESMLSRLSNMRAARSPRRTRRHRPDKPAMSVVARFDDGKKEDRVTFGKNGEDVFVGTARRTGRGQGRHLRTSPSVNKTLDEISK